MTTVAQAVQTGWTSRTLAPALAAAVADLALYLAGVALPLSFAAPLALEREAA